MKTYESDSGMPQERMAVFAESLQAPNPPLLRTLEQEALEDGVPVIRTRTQGLLQFLIALRRPRRILEVGTATGFSALFMYLAAPAGCRVTTIEKDPARAAQARENFARAGVPVFSPGPGAQSKVPREREEAPASDSRGGICLLEGDAGELLPQLQGAFDLIFMDAAKAQYIRYLPDCKRLLGEAGVLVSDNILQGGEILESKFAVTRRNRTIHKRMRAYLEAICRDPGLVTTLLEAGDGTAVSVKKTKTEQG